MVNGLQKNWTSHILLYHGTFNETPKNLKTELHNVRPNVLYKQLKWVATYFDIVNIDEYFQTVNKAGKAVITFDDGYSSFFLEGFSVLRSLGIPCTVFLCGCTFQGKVFWRDKIRFLINNRLVAEFLDFYSKFPDFNPLLDESNFYRLTKTASINSLELNKVLDEFLEAKQIFLEDIQYCVKDKNELVKDSLIAYGNHTYDHFILSSLSEKQQEDQIKKNHEFLQSIGGKISKIFSIPFGGQKDFNQVTCDLLRKYGYIGLLYSRGRINIRTKNTTESTNPLCSLERYMPKENYGLFQKQLTKMALQDLVGRRIFPLGK